MADYTQLYINNDMSKLNTVLQTLVTNGIIGAVDYNSSGTYAVFTFYADAEKTTEVFRITQAQGASSSITYSFRATASDGNTLVSTPVTTSGGNSIGFSIMYGYATSNGVLVMAESLNRAGYGFWFCITKNQNGEPTFIWTNRANANDAVETNMNTEYIVAASDVAPIGTVSRLAPVTRNQTVIAPFTSWCDEETISCTSNAGRVIAGNMNQFIHDQRAHIITLSGVTYITNGYWVLKVG